MEGDRDMGPIEGHLHTIPFHFRVPIFEGSLHKFREVAGWVCLHTQPQFFSLVNDPRKEPKIFYELKQIGHRPQ